MGYSRGREVQATAPPGQLLASYCMRSEPSPKSVRSGLGCVVGYQGNHTVVGASASLTSVTVIVTVTVSSTAESALPLASLLSLTLRVSE